LANARTESVKENKQYTHFQTKTATASVVYFYPILGAKAAQNRVKI